MKKGNVKEDKFDAALAKYASMLPKDYKDQFKKPEYAGNSKKDKVKESLRNNKAVIVTKQTGNKHTPQLNIAKAMDDENEMKQKTVPKEIAIQVQQARQKANKTQDELSKIVECKPHCIKDLEAAEGAYDAQLVVKIEKALKVTFTRSWKK